jgi:hypothetical protein
MTTVTPQRLAQRSKPLAANEMLRDFGPLPPVRPDRTSRQKAWFSRHRRTLAWLLPILVASGLINAINLSGAPRELDGEGVPIARAFAVLHLGQLSQYTYNYDHPPLGWIQIAAWAGLTDGFARYTTAVMAGREAMIVAMLASVTLLWFLARRIGMARGAAAAATLIFALSPAAIQFHRTVYLDNVATPWLLAAVLLATSRGRQLLGFAGSAACLGVAVLSDETFLLALPLVAWLMWRAASAETRRYTLSVAATVLALIGVAFVLFALVRGELFPSSQHPSLVAGIEAVIFYPGGYLQAPLVIMLVPFAALLIAGIGEWTIVTLRSRRGIRRLPNIAIATLAAVAVVAAAPAWGSQLANLLTVNANRSTIAAESWVENYVPRNSRLIVDDSMLVDFVEHGFAAENVVWFSALQTDPEVKAQSPDGWRDSDYVVSTSSMRVSNLATSADEAIRNSAVVASFGTGSQLVQVRRIEPEGRTKAAAESSTAQSERRETGSAVAGNPGLSASSRNLAMLRAGDVDPRISLALGQLTADGAVVVSGLPHITGESAHLLRQVDIWSIGGRPVVRKGALTAEGRMILETLSGPYAPQSHSITNTGLRLTFSTDLPAGLIQ